MNKDRKERLEKAGFRVGSAFDFFDISPEEERSIRARCLKRLKLKFSPILEKRRLTKTVKLHEK